MPAGAAEILRKNRAMVLVGFIALFSTIKLWAGGHFRLQVAPI